MIFRNGSQSVCSTRGESLLGALDGTNRAVKMVPLLDDDPALLAKHGGHIQILPIENLPNLGQRETDKLQRHDLLQTHQITIGVEAIARRSAAAGLQQPETVVVVQRADRNSGAFGKFMRLIGPVHVSLVEVLRSDVASGSREFWCDFRF